MFRFDREISTGTVPIYYIVSIQGRRGLLARSGAVRKPWDATGPVAAFSTKQERQDGKMALTGKAVRHDCIMAFDRFLKDVKENLANVNVYIDGKYNTKTNRFQDNSEKEKRSKGDRGTRTCIVFGGGENPVTTYAFHMRDLSNKSNARARSLRYTPDDKKPPVIVMRSVPGGDVGGPTENSEIEDKMYMRTSRAANSMSFGPMFYGWMDSAVRAGSGEEAALTERMSHTDEKGMTDWTAVRKEPEDGDPLKAMAAWGMVGKTIDGMVARGKPEMADHPLITSTAYQAMGLRGLYRALQEIDGRMASEDGYEPDLCEYMDPDTPAGREALRGILCLSAYKALRDNAGMHGKDENGVEFIEVTKGHEAVYDRMTNARADMETRERTLAALEQGRDGIVGAHCVQKLFAGVENDTGKPADVTVHRHLKYRFFRNAMLSEDLALPSGMPRLALKVRDGADPLHPAEDDILIDGPALTEGLTDDEKAKFGSVMGNMTLKSFLDAGHDDPRGACGQLLGRMPAIDIMSGQDMGTDLVMQYAVDRMERTGETDLVDIMCLEMDLFAASPKDTGMPALSKLSGPEGLSAEDIAGRYAKNQQAALAAAPRLTNAIRQAIGRPDFEGGCASFGSCYVYDIDRMSYRTNCHGECMGDNNGSSAASFRREDIDRADAFLVAESMTGIEPKSTADVEQVFLTGGSVGTFHELLDKYLAEQSSDLVRGSMMLNDFIVMSDCYGIWGADGLHRLAEDVEGMYASGTAGQRGLYRPADRAECDALRQVYGNGAGDYDGAVVAMAYQGTTDGFLSALWQGAGNDAERLSKAVSKLNGAAADHDTFWDARYSELAKRAAGDRESSKTREMNGKAAQEREQDMQSGYGY